QGDPSGRRRGPPRRGPQGRRRGRPGRGGDGACRCPGADRRPMIAAEDPLASWDVFHAERLELERGLSTAAVRAALAAGQLREDDLIRPAGTTAAWAPLADLSELLAPVADSDPPAPAPVAAAPGPAPPAPAPAPPPA